MHTYTGLLAQVYEKFNVAERRASKCENLTLQNPGNSFILIQLN